MSSKRYYQEELAYLRDLGAEFARENPKLAPFLGRESNDPDVERLLEGFAFLTGRLRHKLDDELPELTHSLVQLMWPQFMSPVPAMSVAKFAPVNASPEKRVVPRGVELASRPIDGTVCQFQTTQDVALLPADVERVSVDNAARSAQITVTVRLMPDVAFADLGLERLRFYFLGERGSAAARAAYLALLRHCRTVVVRDEAGHEFRLDGTAISPGGLEEDEAVIPYPDAAFDGYRLLQEYFAFPDKFMFVDIEGLGRSVGFTGSVLTLVFELDQPFAFAAGLNAETVLLNCSPVINLFEADADPIRLDRRRSEYRLTARSPDGGRHDIHSVRHVTGWIQGKGSRVEYPPFEAFRALVGGGPTVHYAVRRRPSIIGDIASYMAFVRHDGAETLPDSETVSVALRCTNGRIASHVPIGSLDQPTGSTPTFARFRNVQAVTDQVPPPIGRNLLWPLISNMAMNLGSILSVDAIRALMSTYHFRAHSDSQEYRRLELMLEGLQEVTSGSMDWVFRGLPVRGADIRLTIEESKYGGDGDVFLFGTVFNRLLQSYANINAVHRLSVRGSEGNRIFQWPIRGGSRRSL